MLLLRRHVLHQVQRKTTRINAKKTACQGGLLRRYYPPFIIVQMKISFLKELRLLLRELKFYALLGAFFVVLTMVALRPDLLVTILVVGKTFLPKP